MLPRTRNDWFIISLANLGRFLCSSKVLRLWWAEIDWDPGGAGVATQTKRHEGKAAGGLISDWTHNRTNRSISPSIAGRRDQMETPDRQRFTVSGGVGRNPTTDHPECQWAQQDSNL